MVLQQMMEQIIGMLAKMEAIQEDIKNQPSQDEHGFKRNQIWTTGKEVHS
jgi:hypothetical protein